MKKIYLLTALLSLTLVGCASEKKITYSYITTDSAPVKTSNANAQSQLAESALSVTRSLQELSTMQQEVQPRAHIPRASTSYSTGLTTQSSIDWSGPIAPLLEKIAEAGRYNFRVIGKEPAIPVLVLIHARDEALADIVRSASLQAVKKAEVSIYPHSRVIELRYLTT